MAHVTVDGVRIAGVAAAVPAFTRDIADDARLDPVLAKVSRTTGVKRRRVAHRLCTSDLCAAAAEALLDRLGWPRDSFDLVVHLSQSPDHRLPATACVLQQRLGLPTSVAALDMALGCSGYVYGLTTVASMMAGGGFKRALVLVGDTSTRMISPEDRSVAYLFGDGGSATVLERTQGGDKLCAILGSDGSGAPNLIIPAGGYRQPHSAETAIRRQCEGNNRRSDDDLYMNGPEIFSFSTNTVPGLYLDTLRLAGWEKETVECAVFHQANKLILDYLAADLGIPSEKMLMSLAEYGNSGSASIPVTMVANRDAFCGRKRAVLLGFGVGYSWGCLAVDLNDIIVPPMVEVFEDVATTDGNQP